MKKCLVLLVMLCGLVFPVIAQEGSTPTFEPGDCPEGITATECGVVVVPADRENPGEGEVRLSAAVVRSEDPNQVPDPIFFLAGGPGETGLIYAQLLAPIFPNRDVVAFDQRGVNTSEPALNCPEYAELIQTLDSEASEEAVNQTIDALIACGERLTAEGIDLSNFNTTESAADVNAIRQALGYDQINLIGASYGTRLAQEVLRSYPETLRSVVLDSVIPTSVDRPVETVRSAADALQRFFDACAADEACSTEFPDLPNVYQQVLDTLDEAPPTVTIAGAETELNGDALQALVFGSLYVPAGVAELPALIYAVNEGNYAVVEQSVGAQFAQAVSDAVTWGKFFATECQGEVASSDPAALEAAYEEFPEWRGTLGQFAGISSTRIYEICEAWGLTEQSSAENDPVQSEVPVLLLAGEFDPVTPPRFLEIASEGLANSYAYEFPGLAHAVSLSSGCGLQTMLAFINDPTTAPDTACIDSLGITFLTADEFAARTSAAQEAAPAETEGAAPAETQEAAPVETEEAAD